MQCNPLREPITKTQHTGSQLSCNQKMITINSFPDKNGITRKSNESIKPPQLHKEFMFPINVAKFRTELPRQHGAQYFPITRFCVCSSRRRRSPWENLRRCMDNSITCLVCIFFIFELVVNLNDIRLLSKFISSFQWLNKLGFLFLSIFFFSQVAVAFHAQWEEGD